ncbi:MAG: decaprenyl-phosphate phosphoribosyltransferase [Phycisphaerae bacterium]|jgi:4-hydroxybenzoate polyprenyltransferase
MERVEDISEVRTPATVGDFAQLFRPAQWIKNVVIFAGPAAALKLASIDALLDALIAFISFCLAASATYAINDVMDREADARHPKKRHRPVARGAIRPPTALAGAGVLIALAVTIPTIALNGRVTTVLLLYLLLTLAYSLALKSHVILDVILVASGFVLRAWAGSLAVGVVTSAWLVACVFTLCLFLGFGKRRCELAMIGDTNEAGEHRRTLLRYTPDLLNHLLTVSAGIAVITFLLYTMDSGGHPSPFHKEHLFYTLPLVVYGVFRYAMLTELGVHSGPTEIVLHDRPLLVTIVVWTAIALLIAYQNTLLGPQGIEGLWASG